MKPKVLIITTGGTIASQTEAPLIEGPALVQAVPQLLDYAEIEVEEFVRIGSSKMTPALWLQLVKRIKAVLDEKPKLKCIVITHGTDTMEETAFFLNLTHRSEIPIVLVGAMRASNEISADGSANLINAVRVGISEDAVGKGVLVVLNENIIAARDLVKMHNRRVDAFPAPERGFLGAVDPEQVSFFRSPLELHTTNSEFDIYALDSLPKIDLLQDFAGLDPNILSYFLHRDNRGVVISSFAGGRFSGGIAEVISQLPDNHKPIVIASSIKGGRIMGSGNQRFPGKQIIISNDLPPNKARILLMLALSKTMELEEIQALFKRY